MSYTAPVTCNEVVASGSADYVVVRLARRGSGEACAAEAGTVICASKTMDRQWSQAPSLPKIGIGCNWRKSLEIKQGEMRSGRLGDSALCRTWSRRTY
jgi:hypothetical protein